MRKRELLIIAAFVVMGIVAYQLTAAPTTDGRRRFSLDMLIDEIRRETGGGAMAAVTTEGTIDVGAGVAEARISGVPHVTVRGAARRDIAYTLKVEANGRTEQAARESASRGRLSEDHLGEVLSLRANVPREGRQVATLSLVVPSGLRLRVEGSQGGATLDAADISAMHLDGVVGDVRLSDIAKIVAGTHRNGKLSVARSGTVDLLLQNSETTLDGIRERVRVSARNGHSTIVDAGGLIDVSGQNEEMVIRRPRGSVRVTGTGGSFEIDDPYGEGYVDLRGASVTLALSRAVAWTILTTEDPIRLQLTGEPAIRIDAIATDGGAISAEAIGASPRAIDDEMRLVHQIGAGTSAVALRNRRGAIVIGGTK